MLIRLAPSEDGTFAATRLDVDREEYVQITAAEAVKLLAQPGTIVEVAVNDLTDPHSHWESTPAEMERI